MKNSKVVIAVISTVAVLVLIIGIIFVMGNKKQDDLSAEIAIDFVYNSMAELSNTAAGSKEYNNLLKDLQESIELTDKKYELGNSAVGIIDKYVKNNTEYASWEAYKQYIEETYLK